MQRIRDWRIWCWHHWWIPVMIIIMGSVVVVALFGNDGNIQRMEIIGNAFTQIITPLCAVLGIILGYPLLKK